MVTLLSIAIALIIGIVFTLWSRAIDQANYYRQCCEEYATMLEEGISLINRAKEEIQARNEKIEKLSGALKFYANNDNYLAPLDTMKPGFDFEKSQVIQDEGEIAQTALRGKND